MRPPWQRVIHSTYLSMILIWPGNSFPLKKTILGKWQSVKIICLIIGEVTICDSNCDINSLSFSLVASALFVTRNQALYSEYTVGSEYYTHALLNLSYCHLLHRLAPFHLNSHISRQSSRCIRLGK